jgi:hypothetical protein
MDSAARDLGLFMAVCLGHFDHFAKGSGSKFPALGEDPAMPSVLSH